MTANCPKCGRRPVLSLNQHRLTVGPTFNDRGFTTVALKCGYADCQALVGFGPDHWPLVDHVADAVARKLSKSH
jgi:hypothetical protein